jgi:hypothetical protein
MTSLVSSHRNLHEPEGCEPTGSGKATREIGCAYLHISAGCSAI